MRRGWLVVALASCGDRGAETDDPTTPVATACADPALTWEGFAQPLLTTWCTPCHGADLTGDARHGAPDGVDFDTLLSTQPFAERIRARVVDDQTMPPTNAIDPEDRVRLGVWLDCGLPGTDVLPPALSFCDKPRYFDGDITTSDLPPGACTEWDAVSGTATLDQAGEALTCLCAVDGDLVVTAPDAVVLPTLTSVGGDLRIESAASTTSFEAPYLVSIGGNLLVTDDPTLTAIRLLRLASVGEGVVVARNPALTDASAMHSLVDIGAGMQWVDLDALITLDAAPYAKIDGMISVTDNDALVSVWLGEGLVTNSAGIAIANNPTLLSILGLENLEAAGDLTLRDLPQLTTLPVLNGLKSTGAVTIAGNDALATLSGLDGLRSVAGTLDVSVNAALTDVSALTGITEVNGDALVRQNPQLPTTAADALIDAIGRENITGSVSTTGNGPD